MRRKNLMRLTAAMGNDGMLTGDAGSRTCMGQ